MDCIHCNEPIPEARLNAIPSACECVKCLESNGDVSRVLMFVEPIGTKGEDFVESYTDNPNQYEKETASKLKGNGFIYQVLRDDDHIPQGIHKQKIRVVDWSIEKDDEVINKTGSIEDLKAQPHPALQALIGKKLDGTKTRRLRKHPTKSNSLR